ncbi:NlpC/P60 family protein [Pseudonocardia sp. KRD291]|uniref:NlpC/P60 family protein n=1 Tax=Pseudonocardia sp. KRD291 TaxID=2792007 RepID=UPI001C4A5824|nr:NlpC/P60 family protein [Pseudonocardia sp. KRD291]MBW0103000.1 C40 family peptidase [Pseudonocardia sp. KRD291]
MTRKVRRPFGTPAVCATLGLLAALLASTPGIDPGPVAAVYASTATANAAPAQPPPPVPPPNPGDGELERSRGDVAARAAEVGRLTARLSELAEEADQLQIQVASQRESANQARDTSDAAGAAAVEAADRAEQARRRTEEAGAAIDAARTRLDEFVAGIYGHGLDLGPLGLLSRATDPQDLMDRARLTDALSQDQADALDQLERARVAQANADSLARAAQEEADRRKQAADEARSAADQALVEAQQAAAEQSARLDAVNGEQAAVAQQLDAAQNSDATLRGQRARFEQWQAAQAAAERARERAQQAAAEARNRARASEEDSSSSSSGPAPAPRRGGSDAIETVIDRAMAQIGVRYSWGGGNSRGPTKGIRDGGAGDANRDYANEGFDCSGLMLYAFAGIGVDLPRYSGNQHKAGEQVPADEMRRGDMLAWAEDGRTYHIALYLGDGKMLEAPYSGSEVKVSPVRYKNLMDTVTRLV